MKEGNSFKTVDEYIKSFPANIQIILKKIRSIVRECAPEAIEKISYQMPCFKLNHNLVYFGAFKDHIGFFPTPSGTDAFKRELSKYKSGKGSIRFPLNEPIPYDLIKKIVEFRVKEDLEKKK